MPRNLDDSTKSFILRVAGFTVTLLVCFILWGHLFFLPRLRRRALKLSSEQGRRAPPQSYETLLLVGCGQTILVLSLLSFLFTLPIILSGRIDSDEAKALSADLTSSINFCEDDFQFSRYVAEPANVASSLGAYLPLAFHGLAGPPSQSWRRRPLRDGVRFAAAYATLGTIGVGSMALHALLTSWTQGGDEIPMLWYTATTCFCAFDILCWWKETHHQRRSERLGAAVGVSAIGATVTYILNRSDFTVFSLLFAIYSQTMILSILYLVIGFDWEHRQPSGPAAGIEFQVHVLLPLATTSGLLTIMSIVVWASEMVYCHTATRGMDFADATWVTDLVFVVWKWMIHPLWHVLTGLLAWIVVQVLFAAHGTQRGWGVASVKWSLAPYVLFEPIVMTDGNKAKPKKTL